MNVRDGGAIGTAVVDVPPPLDKPAINEYSRFVARKLMTGMAGAWESYAANPPPEGLPPAPPPPPAQTAPLPPVPPPSAAPQSQPSDRVEFSP
jgi:hypothetical protein